VSARPSRKQARRDALFLLYQLDLTGRPLEELVAGHKLREGYRPDDFTIELVRGVVQHEPELDARLEAQSDQWPLFRMAPLERSALRMALFEMESGLTPPAVAIDEAVRLVKRYATEEAGNFVNGVLGGIVRKDGMPDEGGAVEPDEGSGRDEEDHA
jgi:transcription antitermination protein NusB